MTQAYFDAFNEPLVAAVGVELVDELEFPPIPPNCPPDDIGAERKVETIR